MFKLQFGLRILKDDKIIYDTAVVSCLLDDDKDKIGSVKEFVRKAAAQYYISYFQSDKNWLLLLKND